MIPKCPSFPPVVEPIPDCLGGDCQGCLVWRELSTNHAYRNAAGVAIPTMGGRKPNLLFRFLADSQTVRVWRENRSPNFTFNEEDCKGLCRRYQEGLLTGALPPPNELGGTSYFTQPAWNSPPLGRNNTPYAAAVVRYVWPLQ